MKGYLGVVLMITGLLGAGSAFAQSEAARSAREEVLETVDRLAEIRNAELDPAEKERREVILKRSALEKIVNLSIIETSDLKNKLEGFTGVPEELTALQDQLLIKLESYLTHFRRVNADLKNTRALLEIQSLASNFKSWRESVYNPEINEVLDFILVFQDKAFLKTAEGRLLKFTSEVKKTKLSRESYQPLLNEAARNLRGAREANNQALNRLANYLGEPLSDEVLPEPSLRELVEASLTKIRSAYRNLIDLAHLAQKAAR